VAWVTKHDIDFGLIRMYELWHEAKLPGYVRVFRTIAEAETWLQNQPKKDADWLPDP
jgi:hypothetical protein